MQLSKQSPVVEKYIAETLYGLPEKVLQFGTGVLLRGLCDYYIDKANKQHVFNGRIVVVKSTDSSGADEFAAQDNLYTHFIRGIEDGVTVDDTVINASISRVLSAKEQWPQILACAANPDMKLIISNTTEIGISYLDEDITTGSAPQSFPGKLLAFLYARYKTFSGSAESGMVVIPTELIVNNADKLKEIVIALASYNRLGEAFVEWVDNANYFCNSLVDRIVPGKLPPAEKRQAEEALAYTDELMLMSEVYSLWAIESAKEKVLQTLSFSTVDKGVVLAPDITRYRELKLRLLNGPHTLCCGLAVLCGFETVKDAMQDETFYKYVHDLMMKEIAPALSNGVVSLEEAKLYAQEVLYRFRNPFLQHKWLNITLQYTSKMLMRNVPNILNHYAKNNTPPKLIAFGFAVYIRFMQSRVNDNGQHVGNANESSYIINDDKARILHAHFSKASGAELVRAILADETLWGTNLASLFEFADFVSRFYEGIMLADNLKQYMATVL